MSFFFFILREACWVGLSNPNNGRESTCTLVAQYLSKKKQEFTKKVFQSHL